MGYVRTFTFAVTGPIALVIRDPNRADDSGSLKVTVQRV
jgi:hypothetical protein